MQKVSYIMQHNFSLLYILHVHEPYIDLKTMLHIYTPIATTFQERLKTQSLPCLLSMFGGIINFDHNSSTRNSASNEIKNGTSVINVANGNVNYWTVTFTHITQGKKEEEEEVFDDMKKILFEKVFHPSLLLLRFIHLIF